ncbi:MAG: hypothetical protein IJJ73_09305 [Bacteroidaceae bacterium]|nr:hypothetical protein [Bacteroidaceae bacterium]
MQILLNIPEVDYDDYSSSSLNPDQRKKINKKFGLSKSDDVQVVNIGPGADWLVLLVTFDVVWNILKAPAVIKEVVEGWTWLIDKLKLYKKKKQLVSFDMDASLLLAIDYLAEKYGQDSSLDLLDAHTINLADISKMVYNLNSEFANHPHNYYVFTFWIEGQIVILGVHSRGEIRELEILDDMTFYPINLNS